MALQAAGISMKSCNSCSTHISVPNHILRLINRSRPEETSAGFMRRSEHSPSAGIRAFAARQPLRRPEKFRAENKPLNSLPHFHYRSKDQLAIRPHKRQIIERQSLSIERGRHSHD